MAAPNPNEWSVDTAFEVFEYTIEGLTLYQDARDALIVALVRLPSDGAEDLILVRGLLSYVSRQVALWDKLRSITNRILKQKLQGH